MSPRVTSLHLDLLLASLWGSGDPVILGLTLLILGEAFPAHQRRSVGLGSLQFALKSLPETADLKGG